MDGWSAGQVVKDHCPPEYQSSGDAPPSPPANGTPSAGGVPPSHAQRPRPRPPAAGVESDTKAELSDRPLAAPTEAAERPARPPGAGPAPLFI